MASRDKHRARSHRSYKENKNIATQVLSELGYYSHLRSRDRKYMKK